MQDSYALCRVFKKNGICSEIEEQGLQCNSINNNLALMESSTSATTTSQQGVVMSNNECCETMSPDQFPMASTSSCCVEEEDKDDSWMQFITDDAWCSSNAAANIGADDISRVAFTN